MWFHDAARWRAGARVLDVACGAGYPSLAAARAVHPGGSVVATDLSRRMIDIASERAGIEGLRNIGFAVQDGEDLQVPSESFDTVTNAYGLMFCADPARALAEARRVLTPGGRVALTTWDLPSESPFFRAIRDAAAGFFELREPGPDEPGPFRLASSATVRAMLEKAGFSSIHVDRLTMTFECDSALDYCQIFKDYGWRSRIDALPPDERRRFHEALAEAMRPYADGGCLRLAATSLCASAQK